MECIVSTTRTLLFLFSYLAWMVIAVGVSPLQAQSRTLDKPKIALVLKSLANEFFITMEEGAKAYQKKNTGAFTLLTNGIKNETDTSAQIQMVEQMIVARADVIIIAPSDSRAMVPVLKKAIDAGIIVVNIDNRLDPKILNAKKIKIPFVGPDNQKGARIAGDYLATFLQPGDEVGILEGVPTTTNAQQRTAGFREAMTAARMKIVSVQSGNWEIDRGNAVAAAMLNAYPNIKALLCGNDNMAIGAISAIRTAGRAGKVLVIGYDHIAAIKPMIANGRLLATVDQFAQQQAVFGINVALKALNEGISQNALSDSIETPVSLITKK